MEDNIIKKLLISLENWIGEPDMSDIGNMIGYTIAQAIDDKKFGYSLDDFENGLKHGMAIINNTHFRSNQEKDFEMIENIKKISLDKDDVLVVTAQHMPKKMMANIHAKFGDTFPDNVVIVIPDTMELSVIQKEKS